MGGKSLFGMSCVVRMMAFCDDFNRLQPKMGIALQIRKDHWLSRVRHLPSPNFDDRARCSSINLIVIHNISLPAGEFGSGNIERLFTNSLDTGAHPSFADLAGVEVASHILIDRAGEVTQFVGFDKRAWHAGISTYGGVQGCNGCSIGIEMEGTDTTPYTDEQYTTVGKLCGLLLERYPGLSHERIVGHCEIAPGRKTDPGPSFDWSRFLSSLF
jgi:AmpD protein